MSHELPRRGNFLLLHQDGPFAIRELITPLDNGAPKKTTIFDPMLLAWRRRANSTERTSYQQFREQLKILLDIQDFNQVQQLISDPQRRAEVSQRAYRLLAGKYGIEGSSAEAIARINSYAQIADGVVEHERIHVFPTFSKRLEMSNEIPQARNPVDLLLIPFDPRYHLNARFEAQRKFVFMEFAGNIDQQERQTRIEENFDGFLGFLNEHVWTPETRYGGAKRAYLLTTHDDANFACVYSRTITEEEAQSLKLPLPPRQKITLLQRRSFQFDGRPIDMYVTIRKKNPAEKVIKLIRKGEENPDVAVDDELGLMGVLNSVHDVRAFLKHLTNSAARAGSFITLEEISDTLSGGRYAGKIGSSPDVRMLKFFAKMGGMRIEFILNTNQTYADYEYRRGVSHPEFDVRRTIDSGVANLIFPLEIYGVNFKAQRDGLIREVRRKIETPQEILP